MRFMSEESMATVRWGRINRTDHNSPDHALYVLTVNGKWLALLYQGADGSHRARFYDLPFPTWEEVTTHTVPKTKTPPGFEDLMETNTGHLKDLLLWVLERSGLPDSYIRLPNKATHTLQSLPYYDTDRAKLEGLEITFSRIRDTVPSFLVNPLCDNLRGERWRWTKTAPLTWQQRYAEDLWSLEGSIAEHGKQFGDPIDSVRVTLIGDRVGERRFKNARSCCGSHEWTLDLGGLFSQRRYRLGFNYGH